MSTSHQYPRLVDELNNLRQQWRTTKLTEGVLLAAAGVAAVLIVLVASDNLLKLGAAGRLVAACLLWGLLAAAVFRFVVRRWIEEHRDDYFAALVEVRHPELHNRLINGLQLGRGNDYGSPRLIEAIVGDAATATAEIDMGDCIDHKPVKRALAATGIAILLIILYALSPRFSNGLLRLLLPLADIPPYTATQVLDDSILPSDGTRFPEGADIDIEAKLAGRIPASATLYQSADGRQWRPAAMQPADGQAELFRVTLPEVPESFRFYIAAGDGHSRQHNIEIVKRPRVERIDVSLTFPDYTARPPQEVAETNGEIAAVAGTKVSLRVTASKPLEKAALRTEAGDMVELSRGEGDVWTGSFVLWSRDAKEGVNIAGRRLIAPTRYQVHLVDTDGYESANSLWRSISLVQDRPPQVSITAPGRDLQSKPEDTVPVTVETRDDFGVGDVRVLYRVNDETDVREAALFPQPESPQAQVKNTFEWKLSEAGFKSGDLIQYWATAADQNVVTGPGTAESRRFSIFLITPEQVVASLEIQMDQYAEMLENLVRLQRENRAQTASGVGFEALVAKETKIRKITGILARAMEKGALPVGTMVAELDELSAGPMADVIRLLESGRDAGDAAQAGAKRNESLPVQDEIIRRLEELLARLQRNEQARKELRRIKKTDEAAHKELAQAIGKLAEDLDRLIDDKTVTLADLEKMPKRPVEEFNEEEMDALKQLDDLAKKWEKWAKGTVNELAKLPTGFVDDFGLREDVNTVFEEIEKAASRPKSSKLEVALEDLGSSKATEMLEDLETWMPDAPDALQWVQEEPLDNKPMNMPEMPLPDALEDLIGDLLQEAEEFDEEADDITSAWGDNLNQAGWGVSDGPISNFSAKGKTGNDLPNNNEVTGRAGDGRRGKSSGQMVGDTARGLDGRKTPARLNNERYEPGQLKSEGRQAPNGSTGGGKKAGAGRKGLQGGTPPDFVRDMERLSEKQAGLREKAEQVARQLDTATITGRRLSKSIELMKQSEDDLRSLRYDDAARKRRTALGQLRGAVSDIDHTTAVQLHRARELPVQLREELLQSADQGYPKGYESLLESYFRALSQTGN